jgi:peptidoglycan/LPS O-acetylase OafA/YrhL
MNDKRLANLDVLRGLAALSVCLYHFTLGNEPVLGRGAVPFSYGYLGVDVFFVISGFVIPLMLTRIAFNFTDIGTFLRSRWLRLYPAYALAAMVAMTLWYLSSKVPGFRGSEFRAEPFTLITNALLIADFAGTAWIVPVFWTLAIEAQYYVLMSLSFPLLKWKSTSVRVAVLVAWISAPLISGVGPTVFTWTALFAVGALFYFRAAKEIGGASFWGLLTAAAASHAFVNGGLSAVAGLATGMAIGYLPPMGFRPFVWMGTISYSLYLLHPPIGGRIMNIAERYFWGGAWQWLAVVCALGASIAAAWVFFTVVERPCHRLARTARAKDRASSLGQVTAVV